MYYQEFIDFPPPRESRTVPVGVHGVHANLSISNMDFAEFTEAAFPDPGTTLWLNRVAAGQEEGCSTPALCPTMAPSCCRWRVSRTIRSSTSSRAGRSSRPSAPR
ncbi:DUF6924 domain-containing protein [Streptomyces phaeochromogenes]|uniref:DUF6924 domain-containing protein n=1 Tax=Streptomyces phaeochromogenes TaxID=1923 RepID=UPI00359428B9